MTWLLAIYALLCLAPSDRKRRLLNLLIALDQLGYVTITFGRGDPDMTMSAAAYRLWVMGKWGGVIFKPVIDALFLPFEREHCHQAYVAEIRRSQLPKDMRRAA